MKLALLCPGQGAQAVGMGLALAEAHPLARETFEAADAALGFSLTGVMWEGPEDELRKTHHAQPALLAHSVAAWRLLEAAGVTSAFTAGHSLGEYSACVAAGALTFEDALRLVHRRGQLMYEAGIQRPGGMAALLGLDREAVDGVCRDAADAGVVVAANLNAPGQVVISGEVEAVDRACAIAKERGAKRAIRLVVSGAFHSPLMESAAAGLAEALAEVPLRDASCPVICNVDARPVRRAGEIRDALQRQLLGAVRWEDSMRLLLGQGLNGFIEAGTGKVLRGLLRSIDREAKSWNVEDPASLEETLAALGMGSAAPERG